MRRLRRRRTAGSWSVRARRAHRASVACPAWRVDVLPLGTAISSLLRFVSRRSARSDRERRGRASPPRSRTPSRVAIRAAARTQPPAILPAQRLDGQRERHHLPEKRAEVDLLAPEPPRLELVAQAHAVARQRRCRFRIGRHARPGRLEDQSERLAERRSDSGRDSGCIRASRTPASVALEIHVLAHAVGASASNAERPRDRRRSSSGSAARAAFPPGRLRLEVVRGRASPSGDRAGASWTASGLAVARSRAVPGGCERDRIAEGGAGATTLRRPASDRLRRHATRPHPLRAQSDRLPAHRRRPHGALQLGLHAPPRRPLRAAHRGHRPRALDRRVRGGRARRPRLARHRLGRGPYPPERARRAPPRRRSRSCSRRAAPTAASARARRSRRRERRPSPPARSGPTTDAAATPGSAPDCGPHTVRLRLDAEGSARAGTIWSSARAGRTRARSAT